MASHVCFKNNKIAVFTASAKRPSRTLSPGIFDCISDPIGNTTDLMQSFAFGPTKLAHDWQALLWAIEAGENLR